MSDERRRRQQEAMAEQRTEGGITRKVLVGVAILAAFAGAFYLGERKRASTLDGFAQCLAGKGVKIYGLYWCTHCAEQKEWFGSSFQYIPYIECGIKGSQKEEQSCVDAGVRNFPTWQFADGERKEGPQALRVLSAKTGCSLP